MHLAEPAASPEADTSEAALGSSRWSVRGFLPLFVASSRFLGGPHRALFFWHYVGNKLLTLMSDMVTNLNLSDVWTRYEAFKREVLETLDLLGDRFGFEQEINSKVAAGGWRVYEVPISYFGRTHAEGKKITWKDGLRGFWCFLRYSLVPRRTQPPRSGGVPGT